MGCKPKCGYHSLSSIVCFFPIFCHSNFLLFLVLFLFSVFRVHYIYCKFGVGSFIAVDAYLHKHCFIWQTQAHEVLLLCTVYTLKMFFHLRTYSFFCNSLSALLRSSLALLLRSVFFFSYWNNAIQRKKLYLVYVCIKV